MSRVLFNSSLHKATATNSFAQTPHPLFRRSTRNKGVWGSAGSSRTESKDPREIHAKEKHTRNGENRRKRPGDEQSSIRKRELDTTKSRNKATDYDTTAPVPVRVRWDGNGDRCNVSRDPSLHSGISTLSTGPRAPRVDERPDEGGSFQLQRGTLLYHLFIWFDCINWTWSVLDSTTNPYFRHETACTSICAAVST